MKLKEVADKLGCRLEGDGNVEITGVSGIDHAVEGQITFLANRRYSPLLKSTRASGVLIEDGIAVDRDPQLASLAALRTENPYLAFAEAIELFYQAPVYAPGIHPTAVIAKSARISPPGHISVLTALSMKAWKSPKTQCSTVSSQFIVEQKSANSFLRMRTRWLESFASSGTG